MPPARGVAEFTRVWNEAFARHWGQTPFSDAEVQALVEVLAPAGMLDVSRLAYDRGVAVGVVWIVPTTASLALTAPGRDVAPNARDGRHSDGHHDTPDRCPRATPTR